MDSALKVFHKPYTPTKKQQRGNTLKFLMKRLRSVSGALTPRNLGVLNESVSYELSLPGLLELVEDDNGVPCSIKQSQIRFREILS